MGARYYQELFTSEVIDAQRRTNPRPFWRPTGEAPEPLSPDERAFIAERDSFYMATVTSEGWPYVQHRGGPKGFLVALDDHTLGFADLRGNRQLISAGNLSTEKAKVSLIAIDYPRRERFKLIGYARLIDPKDDPALLEKLRPSPKAPVERLVVIDVIAHDWNCPAYITPRYTVEEVQAVVSNTRQA